MKKFFKYILLAPLALASLMLTGCQKDDADKDKGKDPVVSYFRSTDPAKAGKHITKAYLGETIAICGENLGDVQQVWFNDQKALLNPTMVTSEAIVVTVPNNISDNVTNTVRLVTSSGKTATVDFLTKVPDPQLATLSCEWANPGDVVDLAGDFFVADDEYPLVITFPGDITVPQEDIISMTRTNVTFKVPAGATQEGRVTAATRYGEGMSNFVYRDSRAMILDWDGTHGQALDAANGWRPGTPICFAGTDEIPALDGNFILFSGVKSDYDDMSEDNFSFSHWPFNEGAGVNSLDITTLFDAENFADYCLKFEAFVPKSTPWMFCALNILFTPYDIHDDNTYYFNDGEEAHPRAMWCPWYNNGSFGSFDTADRWVTVSIPLTDFTKDRYMGTAQRKITPADFAGLSMIVAWGYNTEIKATPVTIALDNIRIAPLEEEMPVKDDDED